MIDSDGRMPQLVDALVEVVQELPPAGLGALTLALASGELPRDLARFAATPAMKDKLRRLEGTLTAHPEIDGPALSLALQASGRLAAITSAEQHVEIAWTGPGTGAVPVRRVDQLVYEMVTTAKEEVLLVTYAAYKAERAVRALREATARGVTVKLVIELKHEGGGKLSFDGLRAFRSEIPMAKIFYWPLDKREHNSSGVYGSMHAKCLVADKRRALVSSANLTDYALEANMELGIVAERGVAARLAEHFDQLILLGELVLVPS